MTTESSPDKLFEKRSGIFIKLIIFQVVALLALTGVILMWEMSSQFIEGIVGESGGEGADEAAAFASALILTFSMVQLVLSLAFSLFWNWRVGRTRIFPFNGDPFKGLYAMCLLFYVLLAILSAALISFLTFFQAVPMVMFSALGSIMISLVAVAWFSPPEARYTPIGAKLIHRR